ncbi:MAG: helix-turn-helix domain-containing protein [Candidatus Heimdallarchaeota archaeon]|nr:helix-turn-helix domain-containing protein [Candidatus Heimdallarchaeota archaeon]
MEIHIATVGLTKEPIFHGVNSYPVDKLVLLHSNDDKSELNAKEISDTLEKMEIECEIKEVDAFDFENVIIKVMEIHKQFLSENISINITGGTKIMASAALLSGYILGLNVYYIQDGSLNKNTGKSIKDLTIELPVPKINIQDLEETQRDILSYIFKENSTLEKANTELYEALKISKQNASYHLKKLAEKELITLTIDGRNKIARLTNTGRLFARIFTK